MTLINYRQEEFRKSLLDVRNIAANVSAVKEFYLNEVSRVVSFRNSVHNCRINVYYTTGTVGTCLLHPVFGRTQLFRRNVTHSMLREIFINPHTHTGEGYYTKDIFDPDNVLDEEAALREELLSLEPRVLWIKARLAEIEQEKLLEAQKQAQILKDKRDELRKKAESEAKAAAKVRAAAEAKAAAKAAAEAEAERVRLQLEETRRNEAIAKSRKVNQRGNNYVYNIDCEDLPYSAADVMCIALAEGGSVHVDDNGDCVFYGLPDEVSQILVNQKYTNIEYIALGEWGQYYIRKKNGREIFSGSDEFEDAIRNARTIPELVVFGMPDSFYIQFQDGTKSYSDDLYYCLPEDVFHSLVSEYYQFRHVALGSEDSWGCTPYCLVYENGYLEYDHLNYAIEKWIKEKHPGTKVKQVFIGQDDNYLIRYS